MVPLEEFPVNVGDKFSVEPGMVGHVTDLSFGGYRVEMSLVDAKTGSFIRSGWFNVDADFWARRLDTFTPGAASVSVPA